MPRSNRTTGLSPLGAAWEDERSLGTPTGRMAVLAGLGVALGLLGGVAAFAVVRLVGLLSNLALLHRVGFDLPNLRHYHPTPVLIPIALAGALVVVALARWSPVIKGHGIPESIEAVRDRESRIAPRAALAKPVSAAIAMGTGGPFGAEGPIIVTGAAFGSLIGQLLPTSPAERRILLGVGGAAGMAGVFGTPVAGVVFAFELLVFERSLRTLLPLVLATSIADALHRVLIGAQPLFALERPSSVSVPPEQLPLFALLGVAIGLLAVLVNKGLFRVEALYRRLPIPDALHPLVGAVGFAAIGLAVPGTLSVGYWAITDAVNNRFLLEGALVLCVAKLVSWWIALGSNTSGGTLAPIFLVGATMGEAIGQLLARLLPAAHLDPGAFALVAMGASFGVGAQALLTGVIFAAEVTGGYGLLLPLLLATGVAEVVAERWLPHRIMTDKLLRRGARVELDTAVDPLRLVTAAQAVRGALADGGLGPNGAGTAGAAKGLGSPRGTGTYPRPDRGVVSGEGARAGDEPRTHERVATGRDGRTPQQTGRDGRRPQQIDAFAYLADALPAFLAGADSLEVVEGGSPIGLLRPEALAQALRRHELEEVRQAPNLRFRLPHRLSAPPADPSGLVGGDAPEPVAHPPDSPLGAPGASPSPARTRATSGSPGPRITRGSGAPVTPASPELAPTAALLGGDRGGEVSGIGPPRDQHEQETRGGEGKQHHEEGPVEPTSGGSSQGGP